jgi:hypothetical protein
MPSILPLFLFFLLLSSNPLHLHKWPGSVLLLPLSPNVVTSYHPVLLLHDPKFQISNPKILDDPELYVQSIRAPSLRSWLTFPVYSLSLESDTPFNLLNLVPVCVVSITQNYDPFDQMRANSIQLSNLMKERWWQLG